MISNTELGDQGTKILQQRSKTAAWMSRFSMAALCLIAGRIGNVDAETNTTGTMPRPSAIGQFAGLQDELRGARNSGDWHAYLKASQKLKIFLNGAPNAWLETARAQVRNGDTPAALRDIGIYALMGQSSPTVETLDDFAPLRSLPSYRRLAARLAVNRTPVSRSSVMLKMSDAALLPEDIDYHVASKSFLLSSVLQSRIVSLKANGQMREFAKSPDNWPVLALKIDKRRGLVWATEVAMEGFKAVDRQDQGRSAILCFELSTGKLLRRIEAPRPSALGDIALTADGEVIASDGEHGGIYRLRPGADALERLDNGEFISPQTAVPLTRQELLVPDYVRGIGLLNLVSKKVRWISMSGRYALNGIDGLYRHGRTLLAVQNGTSAERVVELSMNETFDQVLNLRIIERSTPTLGDPTHGILVGHYFYYIANSGWNSVGDDGLPRKDSQMSEPLIMRTRLTNILP